MFINDIHAGINEGGKTVNEVALMDKNLSMERTPQLIAIEINSIKEQTRKQVLFNSIEIGRRLAEAKIMLGHGEWGDWLDKSVDYSQRTASNLMRIFDEYGTSQISLFCDNNAKSQALANLNYTQAVALMGIPQEDREAFIQEQDIDNMSTRELQQAIKDRDHAQKQAQELQEALTGAANHISEIAEDRDKIRNEKVKAETKSGEIDLILRETQTKFKSLEAALAKEKEESKAEIEYLGQSISDMNKLLEDAQSSGNDDETERLNELLKVSLKRTGELERQLKETPTNVTVAEIIEKVPEAIEQELAELRERNKELEAKGAQPISTATIRFKLHFDSLVKGFGDLLGVLNEIDADDRDKYKNAVKGLIGKMTEKL